MLLQLQKGILYGPIDSRRLGKSLGINLMPVNYKLCSFNCVYCHYGHTDFLTLDVENYIKDLPPADTVLVKIKEAMMSSVEFNYLTFSGNGEPTLHPGFGKIVEGITSLRTKYRPDMKIALLSNSSGLHGKGVRESLSLIDLPVFKLDVGNAEMFKKINRPANGVDFDKIIEFLKQVEGICIQTVLMRGNPSNIENDELETYFEKIAVIKPIEVQMYSLDRPVPNREIKRILPEELEKIALLGSKKTGIRFKAFYL